VYKANRPTLPDDFKEQLAQLPEATQAFNVATMRQPEFEADDLIATYASAAEREGHLVTIVSSDKDLMQLVSIVSRFTILSRSCAMASKRCKTRYGVLPAQMIDVQALAGDTVDNVLGVPGIGMKTAASLINQFGSLDALYDGLDQVKNVSRRKSLLEHHADVVVSRRLVALARDAPMPQPISRCAISFICSASSTIWSASIFVRPSPLCSRTSPTIVRRAKRPPARSAWPLAPTFTICRSPRSASRHCLLCLPRRR
jgi:DNA polymerase-1